MKDSKGKFQKGHTSWNKGIKYTPEQKTKLNLSGLTAGGWNKKPKIKKFCKRCKKEFEVGSWRKSAKYCSFNCAWPPLFINCHFCGKKVRKPLWEIKAYKNHFCSCQCKTNSTKGKKPHNFKGWFIDKDGYKNIYASKHPNKTTKSSVKEHRLIMEHYIGRYLKEEETIHHKNGDKLDNRIENLEIVSNSEHARLHSLGKDIRPLCYNQKRKDFITPL